MATRKPYVYDGSMLAGEPVVVVGQLYYKIELIDVPPKEGSILGGGKRFRVRVFDGISGAELGQSQLDCISLPENPSIYVGNFNCYQILYSSTGCAIRKNTGASGGNLFDSLGL